MENIKTILTLCKFVIEMMVNSLRMSDDYANNNAICQKISKSVIDLAKINLKVVGVENIPSERMLLVSNHRSFFDIFLLTTSLGETVPFAAAKELSGYPFLRRYISRMDCLLVDRRAEDIAALKKQVSDIHRHLSKKSLILFPEGGCSYLDTEIKPFKKGAFMYADKMSAMIVPAYIHIKTLRKTGKWCMPSGDVTVVFGKPFRPSDIGAEKLTASKLAAYTRSRVTELMPV